MNWKTWTEKRWFWPAVCLLSLAVLAAECVKMARDARFGNYTEEFQWN